MLVRSSYPNSVNDIHRKIASISGLEQKFKACIVVGEIVEDQVVKYENFDPRHSNWTPKTNTLKSSLKDMFVFESYRLINWLEQCRVHGYLPKGSKLRELCKRQKQVRELRDYLMHEEEYIVAGKGKKPKRYLGKKEWGTLNPQSTIAFVNSNVFGRQVEREMHFGNKIEFFEFFELIQYTYSDAQKENFFDLSNEYEIVHKAMMGELK